MFYQNFFHLMFSLVKLYKIIFKLQKKKEVYKKKQLSSEDVLYLKLWVEETP